MQAERRDGLAGNSLSSLHLLVVNLHELPGTMQKKKGLPVHGHGSCALTIYIYSGQALRLQMKLNFLKN